MKNKVLKLGDIIVIIIIIITIFIIFISNLNKYKISFDDSYVEIVYKNEVVIKTDITIDNTYTIKSSDDLAYVMILINNELYKKIDRKADEKFFNTIVIIDNKIYMEEASCKHKDCMKMIIDRNHTMPIICTNGVTIRLVDKDSLIDAVS